MIDRDLFLGSRDERLTLFQPPLCPYDSVLEHVLTGAIATAEATDKIHHRLHHDRSNTV